MVIISGCFHWIGFHMTEYFLKAGEEVIGLDKMKAEKEQHLAMFFDRNSNFQWIEEQKERLDAVKQAKMIIQLDQVDSAMLELEAQEIQKSFFLTRRAVKPGEQHGHVIHMPLLFGEWMPRTEKGICYEGKHLLFESAEFQSNAVYVGDFVKTLNTFLTKKTLSQPQWITFVPQNKEENQQDNRLLQRIKEELSLEKRLQQLNKHYEQYSSFYNLG